MAHILNDTAAYLREMADKLEASTDRDCVVGIYPIHAQVSLLGSIHPVSYFTGQVNYTIEFRDESFTYKTVDKALGESNRKAAYAKLDELSSGKPSKKQ